MRMAGAAHEIECHQLSRRSRSSYLCNERSVSKLRHVTSLQEVARAMICDNGTRACTAVHSLIVTTKLEAITALASPGQSSHIGKAGTTSAATKVSWGPKSQVGGQDHVHSGQQSQRQGSGGDQHVCLCIEDERIEQHLELEVSRGGGLIQCFMHSYLWGLHRPQDASRLIGAK